jgi:hypothetical protein
MTAHRLFSGLLVFILLSIFACTPFYIASDFELQTAEHHTIAILPFEMTYTGLVPDALTEEDFNAIEEAESKAFMISYYNEVLRSTKGGKKPFRVDLLHHTDVLGILEENDVLIKETWSMPSDEIADLLGVDAVVRASIEKNQLMSDLSSYGIEVGIHVINIITEHTLLPWLPFHLTRSKTIKASYSLIDGYDGSVLWSIAYDIDADWREAANDIIDKVNRKSSKKFPYRRF